MNQIRKASLTLHAHDTMGPHDPGTVHRSTKTVANAFTARRVRPRPLTPLQRAALAIQRELTMYIDRGTFTNRHQAVELRHALIIMGELLRNPEDTAMWGKLYRQMDKCTQMLKGDKSFEAIFELVGNVEVNE